MVERKRNDEKKQPTKLQPAEPAKLPQQVPEPIKITPPTPITSDHNEPEILIADSDFPGTPEDVNLASASADGLLDLSLQADDTSMGGILDSIYTSEDAQAPLQAPKLPSRRVLQARASLERKLYTHGDIMKDLHFKNIRGHYYTKGALDVLFAKDKEGKPRIFFFFGYFLGKIIPQGSSITKYKTADNSKTAHTYLEQLAATYFNDNGALAEGVIPSNKFKRVVFGYSTPYNPDDVDKLETAIKAYIKVAEEKNQKMKQQIEKDLGRGNAVSRISGQSSFELYHLGFKKYRQLKDRNVIAEAANLKGSGDWVDLGDAIKRASAQYGGGKVVSLSGGGKSITVAPVGPPVFSRLYGATFGRFFQGKKK
jgi:hypothetical protein